MKYILLLGLYFKKYKNDSKIRIFADGNFVDQLELKDEIKEDAVNWEELGWNRHIDFMRPGIYDPTDLVWNFPQRIFYYEINSDFIHNKITIEIDDHNNNYSNGFMTKSNMIMIDQVFLFPKCLLSKKRWTNFIKLWSKVYDKRGLHNSKIMFPGQNNTYFRKWMGGKNSVNLEVTKKHGIFFLSPPNERTSVKQHTYCVNLRFPAYLYHYNLINIYDEDQRSHITKD